MMFLIALLSTCIGLFPLAVFKKWIPFSLIFPFAFILQWITLYLSTPSLVWPMFGLPGVIALLLFLLSAIVISASDDAENHQVAISWVAFAFLAASYIGIVFGSSEMMNAHAYSSLIGDIETRQWSQDIQPKNPNHIRLVSSGYARFLADKAMGQDGSIGSQYHLGDDILQIIKGELWYAFPLEYNGYMVASSTGSIPGYVLVSAENPDLPSRFVKFSSGESMVYSPSAYFEYELERHLRMNGYFFKGLMDFSFELDENYHPWWVVSVFEPTAGWSGLKITGVVVVNPTSGESTFYPVGQVPTWIDRVIPKDIVNTNISYWGDLKNGWWNSSIFGSKVDRVKPGDTILIYGNNGDATWVTDVTSKSNSDNSIVGLVYTDAHSGKSVYYKVPGGGTNEAVIDNVNNSKDILFRKLTGVDPQLYNIYGEMVDIIPVENIHSVFQGVAIVAINNIQEVSFGPTISVALTQFEKNLSNKGINSSINKDRVLLTREGNIDRFGSATTSTGTIFYVHLAGIDHLFTGDVSTSIKLPVTKIGDKIKLTYYDSAQSILPMHDFDNTSMVLSVSTDQNLAETKVESAKHTTEVHEDTNSIRAKINGMSDEQLQKIMNK